MKVHEFTIIASGLHPDSADLANLFYEAGCCDASISFQKGVIILEFEREGASFSAAIISAFTDVTKAGAKVERFEPDYLVSLADIAKRSGLTRSALTHYHKGDRAKNFPTPVARVTSESPLWDWHEVTAWLWGNKKIDHHQVVQARVMKEANVVIGTHGIHPDGFMRRMEERALEIEAAVA
jgi:hypothetical protein